MVEQSQHFYEFGPYSLDPVKRLLLCEGRTVQLTPKAFDLLLALVERAGEVVSKDELIKRVWPDSFVEEGNLTYNISVLRRALGERAGAHQYIVTVPGRGYQFVSSVKELLDREPEASIEDRAASSISINEIRKSPEVEDRAERRRPGVVGILAIIVIAAAGIGYWMYSFFNADNSAPFHKMKMAPLTTIGTVSDAVVSPDGKHLAYIVDEGGRQSLWLRQVVAPSYKEIIPSARVRYFGVTFSQDGNYVYYVRTEGFNSMGMGYLYQMAALGGASKKLIADVDSRITFSPDGKRLAFIRFSPTERLSTLIVANADGTEQHRLATRKGAEEFVQYEAGPAWSPDGKTIACAAKNRDASGSYTNVVGVRVEDGAQTPLTSERWSNVGRLAWLQDGSGLVTTAADQESSPAYLGLSQAQIWLISYPDGRAQRITNDLNAYVSASLTADSAALVAVQTVRLSSLWIGPGGEAGRSRQVNQGRLDGDTGCAWTPDGKVVFTSHKSGNQDIWIMDADGSNQRQLTTDAGANFSPTTSPDGRYVVFSSNRTGAPNIWRMDVDGGNPKQLTSGSYDDWPRCSPDGRWVFYGGTSFGKPMVARVSIDGGDPVLLSQKLLGYPAISPDGKLVACTYTDEKQLSSPMKLAIISTEDGEIIKTFDRPSWDKRFCWTTDGRAVMYIDTHSGVSNIWKKPIDGGPAKQLTDFNSDRIFWFEWSRDGKQLLFARGVETSDVVLISNFK